MSIIGKLIQFSTNKDTFNYGVVLEKQMVLHPNNTHVISGYLVQDRKNQVHHIAYYKVTQIIEEQQQSSQQQVHSSTKAEEVQANIDMLSQTRDLTFIPLNDAPEYDDLPF